MAEQQNQESRLPRNHWRGQVINALSGNPSSVRELVFILEGWISDATIRSILDELRDEGLVTRNGNHIWSLVLSEAA